MDRSTASITWAHFTPSSKFGTHSVPSWMWRTNSYSSWQKVSGKCTVKEFLEKYAKPGISYLLSTSNHMTCIKDGRINDTWDCSNRPVKFYWEKEDREVRKSFYEVTIQDNEQ